LIIGPQSGCDGGNLGISRLYQLNYKTGEAVMNFDLENDLTVSDGWTSGVNERAIGGENGEILQRTDRVRTLGEGIPSGIVTIIDASGRVTQLISSSDRVEASGATDIKLISPVYWMQW
jgi:type IV pilus assembly protein PilY1